MLDLSTTRVEVLSGVIERPPGVRKAASLGFAWSCIARSAPCWRVPAPAGAVDGAGGRRLLPVVRAESRFSGIASEVPDFRDDGEGTVTVVGVPPVLGVDAVSDGVVVEPTDSSSSLSNADIDRLLGMPESPASRRDLRSFPNELLRRFWDGAAWLVERSLSWLMILSSSSSRADIDNVAVRPERPLLPSTGVRGEGRVGPEEEPRRGREGVIPSAPPEGRRADDEEDRRTAASWVDGRLEPAGDKATAGVGGPSCPWSSMCSRFASSVLKGKPLGVATRTISRYVLPTHLATNAPPRSTRGRRC